MNNPQWYEGFNAKVDVSESIGVTRKNKGLLEYVAQESHSLYFDSCTKDQQESVIIDSEERYLFYALIIHNGKQHRKLKVDLQNNFTTGNKLYPKYGPQTLHPLDKYRKTSKPKMRAYKVFSFTQGDVNKGNGGKRRMQKERP